MIMSGIQNNNPKKKSIKKKKKYMNRQTDRQTRTTTFNISNLAILSHKSNGKQTPYKSHMQKRDNED